MLLVLPALTLLLLLLLLPGAAECGHSAASHLKLLPLLICFVLRVHLS
jgi:hypothetical protein